MRLALRKTKTFVGSSKPKACVRRSCEGIDICSGNVFQTFSVDCFTSFPLLFLLLLLLGVLYKH